VNPGMPAGQDGGICVSLTYPQFKRISEKEEKK